MDYDIGKATSYFYGYPDWRTIHYSEKHLDYEKLEYFKGVFRAFAMELWTILDTWHILEPDARYILESCDSATAVIQVVYDAEQF